MSETSSEKQMEDTTSLDEDSGHDSVDEISSERERIACLETAVNWIRDEVTQLKDYDRDILQELWRIRNTIHTIRDVHKKVKKEESRFLDESIEDRSPTPEFQPEKAKEDQNQQNNERSLVKTPDIKRDSPPPSPAQSPEFVSSEGEIYRSGTLQLMATAPQHLKQSSDDKLLEEFFGSDQVNKLGFFKSQTSLNYEESKESSESAERRVLQGVSLPNISSAPSNSPLTARSRQVHNRSPYQQYEPDQPVKKRLQIPKNPNADANRISYDVASEMEKLRARLQETAMQELAEFDRKYSPKLHHGNNAVGNDGMRSGELSLNHSRQGSLDSSMSSHPNSTTDLINHLKPGLNQGHTRQHSLPIDPKYYRQLQRERSNDSTPPNMSPHSIRPAGVVIGRMISSGHVPSSRNEGKSPSPPPLGHIRQVSGSSMKSENGAVSPPLVVGSGFQFPDKGGEGDSRMSGKHSKPPGMTRVPSNGSNSSHHQHSSGSVSTYNFNSNNRHSPETQLSAQPRSYTVSQPHYSTGALKRGKRNSGEIATSEQMGSYHQYQQLHHSQPQSQLQHQAPSGTKHLSKSQSYEEKVRAGFRPHTYEKPIVRGQGDTMVSQDGGRLPPHPRIDSSNISSSPKLARMPLSSRVTGRPSSAVTSRQGSGYSNGRAGRAGSHPSSTSSQDDIQPYMTSSQLKQQMFSYTPFSQQQGQQRAYSISSAEPPRLQKKGGGTSRSTDQRTWI